MPTASTTPAQQQLKKLRTYATLLALAIIGVLLSMIFWLHTEPRIMSQVMLGLTSGSFFTLLIRTWLK